MRPIQRASYSEGITLVTLPEAPSGSHIFSEILSSIAGSGINVDMISQTAPLGGSIRVSFTIADGRTTELLTCVNRMREKYPSLKCEVAPGMAKLYFYDENMNKTPGVAARVSALLSGCGAEIMMITTSALDISVLIPEHCLDAVLAAVKTEFDTEAEHEEFIA